MTSRSLLPFRPGDRIVTATRLDPAARYPTGAGAVRQLACDGSLRAEAVTGATGLVAGLGLLADGSLLVLDPQARHVARFAADGTRLPDPDLGGHPFGSMLLLPGGDVLLGEHLCGASGPFAGAGRVHRFTGGLAPLRCYDTQWNGGMAGFLGVTHMAVSPDGATLYHLSETGPLLYAHDLMEDRRLGPVFTATTPPGMLFGLAALPDGDLLVAEGEGLVHLSPAREGTLMPVARYPLPAPGSGRPGWANVILRPSGDSVLALDFHSGRLAEIALATMRLTRLVDLGLPSALASLVEVP
ncbi:MAG: hypothetical protein SNJ63_02440 [Sphingomonadaceae bacterium]